MLFLNQMRKMSVKTNDFGSAAQNYCKVNKNLLICINQ